ncbi:MAG: type 1 glutamine amidotransferase [Burkholderiales bacterium]|nr:type 1 glutamine amidotransferase [Burkholderiales bacterium]PZN01651.1 MAG: glutamine amidotransferase [Pseudomonadota bacterium]
MKPIAIFRHAATEGPGYFADYLDAKGLPWQLVRIDAGDPVPGDPSRFAGLVFMGGPMSVNDDLPWIPEVLALIRAAVAANIPCLGHCLGGQLMAKALGGVVTRNPVKEIGWGRVKILDNTLARAWFGPYSEFDAFHWHGETFSVPEEATLIASSAYCPNQAFVYGKHLGMQCHVEMTPELIRAWCEDWGNEVRKRAGPSIQTPEQMLEDVEAKVRALNAVAAQLYDRWIEGLERD